MEEKEFLEIAEQQGWTPETQVGVLLEYISNQNSLPAFTDFIKQKQNEENNMSDE